MNNSQILNVEPYDDPNYSSTSNNPTTTKYPCNTINPSTTQNTPTTTKSPNSQSQFANVKQSFTNTDCNNMNPVTTKPSNMQENGASQYPNYLIYGNNGCLQYESSITNINNEITPATWAFRSCNSNDPRQQFVTTQVNDLPTYNSFIKDDSNLSSKLNSTKTTTFGFNIVTPINNQDQCLQLNNDGLSVMPCHLEFDQRFRPIYNTVLP